MKSRKRDRQNIWFSKRIPKKSGIDTIYEYEPLIKKKMTVSAGTGTPGQISAGLVVDYDREVVNYDHSFIQEEGNAVWVDLEPQIDEEGNLLMKEDEETPITPPDYVIKEIFRTQKGKVDVFGIKKIGGISDG